jgi:hypothetical protein
MVSEFFDLIPLMSRRRKQKQFTVIAVMLNGAPICAAASTTMIYLNGRLVDSRRRAGRRAPALVPAGRAQHSGSWPNPNIDINLHFFSGGSFELDPDTSESSTTWDDFELE